MSEHEHQEAHDNQQDFDENSIERNPYEHKNPKTNNTEQSNWSFGGWYDDESKG